MKYIIFGILLILAFGCLENGTAIEQPQETDITEENTTENGSAEGQWMDTPEENESEQEIEEEMEPKGDAPVEPEEEIPEPEEEPPAETKDDTTAIGKDGPERIYFDNGNYALVIEDVVWYGDKECAAVKIADAADSTLKKDVICPQEDYYWTTPGGHRYRIVISEVAAGYSTGESWAKVNIYG